MLHLTIVALRCLKPAKEENKLEQEYILKIMECMKLQKMLKVILGHQTKQ